MATLLGPLRWYGFKRFATKEQAEMHQALLVMQGVYVVVRSLGTTFLLVPATETEIVGLINQYEAAEAK